MTAPDIALQEALRNRLISTPAVTALVPAARIRDGSTRPEGFPTIIFANAQTALEGVCGRTRHTRVFLDLHIWTNEGQTIEARELANVVRNALLAAPSIPDFRLLGNFWVTGSRTVRDPKDFGHVVMTVEALLAELV